MPMTIRSYDLLRQNTSYLTGIILLSKEKHSSWDRTTDDELGGGTMSEHCSNIASFFQHNVNVIVYGPILTLELI